jgi:thioesterase domain-containing protein
VVEEAERLREKAREHELNALAARERGDDMISAYGWSLMAIVLYEVAEALDDHDEAA